MTANKPDDVINTSHGVSNFKRCAVDRGYYKDDFIKLFTSPYQSLQAIDLWAYLRITTLRKLVHEFMETFKGEKVQFVDLGSGLSTFSLYLLHTYENVVCFDMDFIHHMRHKAQLIHSSNRFSHLNYKLVDGLLVSDTYKMVHMDFENLEEVYKLEDHGVSRDLPTFFLSEFCLTYVENDKSDKVIEFLAGFSNRPSAYAFLDYVGSWTKFGKWYSDLFEKFGAEFKSFRKYDTIEKHVRRHKELGWDYTMVNQMTFTYNEILTDEERRRVVNLDNFKDFHEAGVYCNHTVIGAAVKPKEELSRLVDLYDSAKKGQHSGKKSPDFIPYDHGFDPDEFDECFNSSRLFTAHSCILGLQVMSNEKRASKFSWSPLIIVLKRNSIELKYYEGEHYKYFAPKTPQIPFHSMYSYIRVTGNRKIFEKFIRCSPNQKIQFVNLGSGLDITSLWILEKFKNAVCFDLDLESQIRMKVNVIKNTQELLNMFPEHTITDTTFHSDKYHILPCDFRNLDELDKLKEFGFSSELPTIYLSEFVLTYVENHLSNKVIERLSNMCSGPSILLYHEYKNNTPLYSLTEYYTEELQIERFFIINYKLIRYKTLGWDNTHILYYNSVYNYMIDKNERKRVRSIENFKDMKHLAVMCSHSAIGVSVKNCNGMEDFLKFLDSSHFDDDLDNMLPKYSDKEIESVFDLKFFDEITQHLYNVTCAPNTEESRAFFDRFSKFS
ncbi:leucine carboxyl methyltransferase [Theileria orientalis strain Shintoku]|uniref:[phosphatase 2A protein]-leucine-carboxy methyltransferase n=1 Tax=Theileria orientalis strain Shintoku TaxID=869250 RepID=J7MCB1_THEOR|nr:leucine carboxyl methyltransferase [Theileria orientalis strain Shintoku]BAM42402.1 leucine carboxyl methyltransferase [Theileria orientalis strain Shintoku]|eukprot:XP_009692703.1 leucine carboxyl methyltransferase [Theileria orientalis strain Shintoku]